ncbi:hypothetical protein C2845_PM15G13290 [Panicum miliaceum]|uniref:Uncharacterized protein n=1 Tax=Panicum miliaceum TaxID=4540 RepID=A0A3L6QBS3_PANMI|nr:hypothetical protein C2845_PM15G13290 [Panicum miliaceum]
MMHQDRNPLDREKRHADFPDQPRFAGSCEDERCKRRQKKRQGRVGFRIPRKAFRLCVRDEYGTRALDDPAVTLRPTPLQREIELRTTTRQITAFFRRYGGMMGSWAAYRQAIPALSSLTSRLNGIL